ncbi:MAG: universal stress protein [Kiloniellales bacterium]|nr:universal stress protein [Kiloniellales bacterium]
MMERILVPTDGSDHALKALDVACDLAHRHDAKVILCHVLLRDKDVGDLRKLAEAEHLSDAMVEELRQIEASPAPQPSDLLRIQDRDSKPVPDDLLAEIGRKVLDAARRHSSAKGVTPKILEIDDGPAPSQILAWAEREGVDTIVMGSRGLRAIEAISFGSVSQKVSQGAPCTCITVK